MIINRVPRSINRTGRFGHKDLYPYDGNIVGAWLCEDASGALTDSNGSNDLSVSGSGSDALYQQSGKNNYSVHPQGGKLWISSSANVVIPSSGDFTLSAWMWSAGLAFSQEPIYFDVGSNDWAINWSSGANEGKLRVIDDGGGGASSYTTSTYHDSSWHHFLVEYDDSGNSLSLTVDNSDTVSVTRTVSMSGGQLKIGDGCSEILIDEITVWNTLLSSAAITALYNGGTGRFYS